MRTCMRTTRPNLESGGPTAYRQTALSAFRPSGPGTRGGPSGRTRALRQLGIGGPGIVKNFVLKRCTSGTVYVNNL